MEKFFTKSLFFVILFKSLLPNLAFGQTVTVNNVDPGPYGQGSTIGVPIHVDNTSGCTATNNTYNLYLSDASGSFANEVQIGSFTDFYATFVNGVIPAGTPAGSGYKVRVLGTSPATVSNGSNSFNITTASGVQAKVTSQVINPNFPEVFGSCNGVAGTSYAFGNQSTPGAAVTASFFNELTQSAEGPAVNLTPNGTFTAQTANYTVSVKATSGGIVGTKEFILINNSVSNSFGASGSNAICLSSGVGLTYNVDITTANGIQNNFPGLTYSVTWGDGTASSFTFCDIVKLGGQITHIFDKSSCGHSANGQNNSFEVDLQPMSKYCGPNGTKVTSYAKVIAGPINLFTPPVAACVNSQVTITNTSYPGDDPNNTSANCVNAPATYTWLVDGVVVGVNYTLAKALQYTFTTAGVHSITLHLEGNGTSCTDVDVTHTICIQNPPQPSFTLPTKLSCVPATIKPINTSVIDDNCNTENSYTWAVNGPAPVAYANGTGPNSKEPEFVFNKQGIYNIKLGITTASCGVIVSAEQSVDINDKAVAKLSPDVILCGNNLVLDFDPSPGPTKSTVEGSNPSPLNPYNWTVTGGAFSFTNGTDAHSQYPQITFNDIAIYTITVTNTNSCGVPASSTQKITFQQAPTVDPGKDKTVCSNETVQLDGFISGGVNSTNWTGGNGTFSPDRNALKPIYTPSADEIAAGTVTLTLNAITSLAPPCNSIARDVTITIAEPDQVISKLTQEVCSNTPLNYQIVASMPNSTFTWQVDPDPAKTTPSASGYTTGVGSGDLINDAIINSDPVNYATVTYNISASGPAGCTSVFPLVVSIAPQQTISKFTQDVTTGCGDLTVQFTNSSIPTNSTYVWDFGDGALSTDVNPSHVFAAELAKDHTYTVTLFATSNCGNSVPYKADVLVRPKTPVPYITPEDLVGCSPFTLKVHNLTDADNVKYEYYLFDGATQIQKITTTDKSDIQFLPITVPTTKQYSLYMIATNACGTTGQSPVIPITISATNIKAQVFPEGGLKKGCVPLTVNLVNNSIGGDTYHYHVYDANNVEIDRQLAGTDPQPYVFKTPGTYKVTVSAENSCSTVESEPWQFDVYPIPVPDFSADVTAGCKNLLVTFTNNTADDINTQAEALLYDWDFGDGGPHSFAFTPPPHKYTYKNSPFTVTLTTTNRVTNCSNVITKTNYINITAPPATAFTAKPDTITSIPNYHFEFIDQTEGSVSSWLWTFGDGKTSTSQYPGHTYADTGKYKVTLVASSKAGCDSAITHFVIINGVPGQLYLPNAFEPTGGTVEMKTFKAKGSGIKEWKMQIFNNYAQLIWETTKLDAKGAPIEAWDGTYKGVLQPQGVYVWQVSATFINGTEWKGNSFKGEVPKRTGVIHLIR